MAQINLLKQNSPGTNLWDVVPGILLKLLAVLLVAEAAYYGWIFYKQKSVDKKIVSVQQQIDKDKNEIAQKKESGEAFTRQGQLKELAGLIAAHPYWSQLLPELARVTLKTASYSTLHATQEGDLTMSVTVPSLTELDKFLQVFDLEQFNNNFSDVRIGSFYKVTEGTSEAVKFDVKLKFNPKVLQYNNKK